MPICGSKCANEEKRARMVSLNNQSMPRKKLKIQYNEEWAALFLLAPLPHPMLSPGTSEQR